ncbi:OapC/ArvC family zinc-ribbon domain-containing protein [Halocalculus aciditolerans]|uniref:Zn-ribbon containing protein n=1 Tax=Halocalculus aciditolerans TaxID=1383812 RepID=A0A830FE78_9EURY|nr:Zn-ribbon containing protein [Halocalculus aciditolerans]GGL46149.1 hypothetical protein GCM10009039_00670 [Halocalculus aciditolerans]
MPHECTNCGHVFPDGSKEMLSGCPDCGGKKFQFRPASSKRDEAASADEPAEDAAPARPAAADAPSKAEQLLDESGDREDVAQASARSEMVRDDDLPKQEQRPADADAAAAETAPDAEAADAEPESDAPDMASLRGQLDDTASEDAGTGGLVGSPVGPSVESSVEDSEPDAAEMEQIREELNAQFESIKVLAPGQYELNLMELYDRDEYIIALQQNGRYVIEVPDGWDDKDE